ncbi:plasmid pRiA4b ORF-3 family protein [Mycolicibacterium sp.]|uniref:plasmid pRiA4b ORF-3 family protein n=1 Tax=Mycolicibacterium sp. TaxID=2320850 RepID=UPI003D135E44
MDVALLQKLMADAGRNVFAGVFDEPTPEVRAAPERVRGFRVRIDLLYAKPPIWRRLDLPGDLMLDELHVVLQAAMGWQNTHLHKFGVGADPRTRAYFVTGFDLGEGDEGVAEDRVRLDQVLFDKGDRLFYDYDFGDGWEHVLVVEDVVDDLPPSPVSVKGKMACPPEDCGGLGGYEELAAWVRDGYARRRRPWGSALRRCGTGCPGAGIPTVSRWPRPTTLWPR